MRARSPYAPRFDLALWISVGLGVAYFVAGCSALTARDAATIEAVDVAACSALTMIPVVGTVAALACPGEEAALAVALGVAVAASAHPDAGLPVSTATALAAPPRLAVHRRHKGGRVRVGYVPAELAHDVQEALYLAAPVGLADAGAEGGAK